MGTSGSLERSENRTMATGSAGSFILGGRMLPRDRGSDSRSLVQFTMANSGCRNNGRSQAAGAVSGIFGTLVHADSLGREKSRDDSRSPARVRSFFACGPHPADRHARLLFNSVPSQAWQLCL